jgi:hypothetical protein
MKKHAWLISGVVVLAFALSTHVLAQDANLSTEKESESAFSIGTDFVSSYIWRGTKEGQGPSLQPYMQFEKWGLAIGVWGDFDASGYSEADPYISYSFPFGLSLTVNDYYFPSNKLFDFSKDSSSHALEITADYAIGGLSLSANYIVNKSTVMESEGSDLYFEAGYEFKNFNIFLGAGNGWHTTDGNFTVCNIGIGTSREIKITDNFSLPVSGQVIVNPDLEALYLVVGISL